MIGILGGTFDPPHIAHLAMAHAAYEQLGLERVLLMPAGDPWQKADDDVTAAHHRIAMTRLAAAEAPYLAADDREITRSGPTYTIDTITDLGEECVLIVGADAAVGIPTWHRSDELIAAARFAVAPRPGVTGEDVGRVLDDRFTWLDVPMIDLSSTELRAMVGSGRTPRFLVPDAVAAYIAANDLYTVSIPDTSSTIAYDAT